MWVFSVDGFFSTVEFRPPRKLVKSAVYGLKPDGKTDYSNIVEPAEYGTEYVLQEYIDQLGDAYTPATDEWLSSHVLVRGRIEADLQILKNWDADAIFFADKSADYKYRAIITRKAWGSYVHHVATTINYSSHVKEEMERRAPKVPGGRYKAFSAIWSAMAALQDDAPWGNTVTYGGYGKSSTSYYVSPSKDPGKSKATWSGVVDDPDDYNPPPNFDEWYDTFTKDTPVDNDEEPSDIQVYIAESGASFDTMRMQLKDIMVEQGILDAQFDLDNAVDQLIDSFGTCDVTTINENDLFEIIYEIDMKGNA